MKTKLPNGGNIPKTKQWRIDCRYSAALELRWLRRCNRMGAGFSNADIRRIALDRFGW